MVTRGFVSSTTYGESIIVVTVRRCGRGGLAYWPTGLLAYWRCSSWPALSCTDLRRSRPTGRTAGRGGPAVRVGHERTRAARRVGRLPGRAADAPSRRRDARPPNRSRRRNASTGWSVYIGGLGADDAFPLLALLAVAVAAKPHRTHRPHRRQGGGPTGRPLVRPARHRGRHHHRHDRPTPDLDPPRPTGTGPPEQARAPIRLKPRALLPERGKGTEAYQLGRHADGLRSQPACAGAGSWRSGGGPRGAQVGPAGPVPRHRPVRARACPARTSWSRRTRSGASASALPSW